MPDRWIPIPLFYISLAAGNRRLFIQYVKGYIKSSYPGWQLKTIKKMNAVIEKQH